MMSCTKGLSLPKKDSFGELLYTQELPKIANNRAIIVAENPLNSVNLKLLIRLGSCHSCCHASTLKLCRPRVGKMPKAARSASPSPTTTGNKILIPKAININSFDQWLDNITDYIADSIVVLALRSNWHGVQVRWGLNH